MKKWISLLIVLLVGIGTLYADTIYFYDSDGNQLDSISTNTNYIKTSTIKDGDGNTLLIKYNGGTKTLNLNSTMSFSVNITTDDGTETLFYKSFDVDGNLLITIKKTNNGWVMVIPTKAPIPPIAIALTLMAIPTMALRRCN
jgi:hypothetical protein